MDFPLPINGPYLRVLSFSATFTRFLGRLGQDWRLLYYYLLFSLSSGWRESGLIDSAFSRSFGLLVSRNYLIPLASILSIESSVRKNTSACA